MNAENARIVVRVVVSCRRIHPVVLREKILSENGEKQLLNHLVEHSCVKPGVHSLARTSCGETASTSHHHVEHAEGDEVRVLVANAFKTLSVVDIGFLFMSFYVF